MMLHLQFEDLKTSCGNLKNSIIKLVIWLIIDWFKHVTRGSNCFVLKCSICCWKLFSRTKNFHLKLIQLELWAPKVMGFITQKFWDWVNSWIKEPKMHPYAIHKQCLNSIFLIFYIHWITFKFIWILLL